MPRDPYIRERAEITAGAVTAIVIVGMIVVFALAIV
jgi:hypothetical protein